ncbi:alpha/beta-hydrolase, partial [Fragilariopsis cylindrus CCMP1102]
IHTLHYEIYGTGSLNALFLHGGPGSGCFPNHARFFDPTKYRVVLLDQRGAGRSSPTACVINNTLSHLVDDCELLRKHLLLQDQEEDEEDVSSSISSSILSSSISSSSSSSWDVILGGSWGTTVALAYAQTYPKSMKSLILRGICTFRPSEIDWLFNKNLLHAYYDRLMAKTNDTNNMMLYDNNTSNGKTNDDVSVVDNNTIRLTAARSWMMWEMAASSSFKQNNNQSADTGNDDTRNVVLAMLTCYYSVNDIFVMGGPNCKNLLSKEPCSNLDPDLKIIGIQGGRDPICPPDTAIDLKAQLSESKRMMELRISLLSGHSMYDPAIMNEIIQATDK